LRDALREKARKRKRWGYRRLIVLLRRDGWLDKHKRIERLYREEGLQVPKRRKRKTAYTRKEKPAAPARMNMNAHMAEVLSTGQKKLDPPFSVLEKGP